MNIFTKHIDLSKKLNVSILSNRATAQTLYKSEIKRTLHSSIIIDFTGIEFASRSFLDELNSLLTERGFRKVQKINMNEQVSKMDNLVTNSENTSQDTFRSRKSEPDLMTV